LPTVLPKENKRKQKNPRKTSQLNCVCLFGTQLHHAQILSCNNTEVVKDMPTMINLWVVIPADFKWE